MQRLLVSKVILIIFLCIVSGFSFKVYAESGYVELIISDPCTQPVVGEPFETAVTAITKDVVLGAYLITVEYDPEKLKILQISTNPDSKFYGNIYTDSNSFETGETTVSAFKAEEIYEAISQETLFTIQWEALVPVLSDCKIDIFAESLIDISWRPVGTVYSPGKLLLYENSPPVANAGPNQTAYLCYGNTAQVTLDGSASYDDDNDVLNYYWSWTIDIKTYEANGVSPTIELPAGEHIIELTVNDGIEDSEPDYCSITVIPGLSARLFMLPRALNPQVRRRMCFAMMVLPEGISASDFDRTEKLMLYPCELQSRYQFAYDVRQGHRTITYVLGVFDIRRLCALLGPGWHEVEVVGQLMDGRCFSCGDTIKVVPKR